MNMPSCDKLASVSHSLGLSVENSPVSKSLVKVRSWHIPDLTRTSAVPSTAGIHKFTPLGFEAGRWKVFLALRRIQHQFRRA